METTATQVLKAIKEGAKGATMLFLKSYYAFIYNTASLYLKDHEQIETILDAYIEDFFTYRRFEHITEGDLESYLIRSLTDYIQKSTIKII